MPISGVNFKFHLRTRSPFIADNLAHASFRFRYTGWPPKM